MIPILLAFLIAAVSVWAAVLVATRRNRSRRAAAAVVVEPDDPAPVDFDVEAWREAARWIEPENEYRGYA